MQRPASSSRLPRPARVPASFALLAGAAAILAGCDSGVPAGTPPITPGTASAPREVNIVMRDYAYVPPVVDLAPGETVLFHVDNGGLVIPEAILADMETQLAWEAAEAATIGAPPGPTPVVAAPAGFDGTRIVVESGQRLDVLWTVPEDAPGDASGWFVGCHIPGHWEKGMVAPVRFVDASDDPMASIPPGPSVAPQGRRPAIPPTASCRARASNARGPVVG